MSELDDKIAKLPAWARNHIAVLSSQREAAVNALERYLNENKKSPYTVSENVCIGKGATLVKRYIHTYHGVTAHYGDMEVNMRVVPDDDGIRIKCDGWRMGGGIAFQATSYGELLIRNVGPADRSRKEE